MTQVSAYKNRALATLAAAAVALVLAACAVCAQAPMAFAQTIQKQWTVEFTGAEMKDEGSAQIAQAISGMQPGDSAEFDVTLLESYDGAADWYMRNEVLKTMEESFEDANSNSGGSYSYSLVYTDPQGVRKVILSNDTVSGDAPSGQTEGLFDATTATGDWFYLDTLASQARAHVVLTVAIDGETHGNPYFDTNAKIQLAFAAEPNANDPGTPGTGLVTEEDPGDQDTPDTPKDTTEKSKTNLSKTGDNLQLGMLIAVVVIAAIALIVVLVKRRRDNEDDSPAGSTGADNKEGKN